MNNKKAIYILLPCVFILWAFIAFKVYNHVKPTEEIAEKIAHQEIKFDSKVEKEIFNLNLNYKDPFLKVNWSDDAANKTKGKKKENKKQAKVRNWSWPDIVYRGCIINHKKTVGLLQISTRDYLVNEGSDINGFLIQKIDKDSLYIEREGELKTIGVARKSAN